MKNQNFSVPVMRTRYKVSTHALRGWKIHIFNCYGGKHREGEYGASRLKLSSVRIEIYISYRLLHPVS